MKAELAVVLLVAVSKPLEKLPVQDSIFLWNPSRVQFRLFARLWVHKISLRVLQNELTPKGKHLLTGCNYLDLVMEIKHWLLPFLCLFSCVPLVFFDIDKGKPLLHNYINKLL